MFYCECLDHLINDFINKFTAYRKSARLEIFMCLLVFKKCTGRIKKFYSVYVQGIDSLVVKAGSR